MARTRNKCLVSKIHSSNETRGWRGLSTRNLRCLADPLVIDEAGHSWLNWPITALGGVWHRSFVAGPRRCALTSWPWWSSDPPAPPEWCWCCALCWCCGRRAAWDEAWTSGPAWCSRNAGWPSHACRRSPPGSGCWTGPAPACWWAAAAASRRRGSTLLKCTEECVKLTAFTVGDLQVFTFDPKHAGVLLHGSLVSQDYGPPQLTERRSVTGRLKPCLAPAADISHSKASNLTSGWGTRTGRGPTAPAPPCYRNLVGPELPAETKDGQKSLSGRATLVLRSGRWSHRFQDADQRGWNPCRISAQQTFGSACPPSDKRKHL